MAKLREMFNKLPTVFNSASAKQHPDSDETSKSASMVPCGIPGVFVCSQTTTFLLSHRCAAILRTSAPKQKSPSYVSENSLTSHHQSDYIEIDLDGLHIQRV